MKRNPGWWTVLPIVLLSVGCGKTTPSNESAATSSTAKSSKAANCPTKLAPPAATLYQFLEAVQTGDDKIASTLLTQAAREKAAALNRNITPSASDTATFSVGEVEYVSHDGARVASTWTDLDDDGQPRTDQAIWVLRNETDGWRIAGVAAVIFPNEPPLLLNFEDPEDLTRKQQWVREEMRRRATVNIQAQEPQPREGPLRR